METSRSITLIIAVDCMPLSSVYPSQVDLATYFLKYHIFYSYSMTYYFYSFISSLADEETET